jgi:hypothetical protein
MHVEGACDWWDEKLAKLRDQFPIQREAKNMTIELTDGQIVRVLDLCEKIAKTRRDLPAAPEGFDVSLEIAKHLRKNLEAQNDVLVELGALLR